MQVIVLIADLVDSRAVPERATFQEELKALLRQVSADAAPRLLSPLTLTLGDEFQAVYRSFEDVLPDLVRILAGIAPVRARFALAVGPLSTRINPLAALEMDGPAFIRARELMQELKSQPRSVIQVGWVDGPDPGLANAALAMLSGMMEGWKPGTLVLLQHQLAGRSVEEIARLMAMTPRGVYKHVAGRHLSEARALLRQVGLDLNARLKSGLPGGENDT
jgi:hypothetical protein